MNEKTVGPVHLIVDRRNQRTFDFNRNEVPNRILNFCKNDAIAADRQLTIHLQPNMKPLRPDRCKRHAVTRKFDPALTAPPGDFDPTSRTAFVDENEFESPTAANLVTR